jgi:hypothetical protein
MSSAIAGTARAQVAKAINKTFFMSSSFQWNGG